jgi:hypothetical protein
MQCRRYGFSCVEWLLNLVIMWYVQDALEKTCRSVTPRREFSSKAMPNDGWCMACNCVGLVLVARAKTAKAGHLDGPRVRVV